MFGTVPIRPRESVYDNPGQYAEWYDSAS